MDDSICDFLLYYNDKLHLTTKVAPYKAIMDASDQELLENNDKHPKKKTKSNYSTSDLSLWQLCTGFKLH